MNLSQWFLTFADQECKGSSLLYQYLSEHIARDEDILELASHGREGQPIPNLFLGAVHFLLMKGVNHELRHFYPSLVENPKPIEQVYPCFQQFCQDYHQEIVDVLKEKRVQTNEVRRCAYLYPIFCEIYNRTNKPLSLIEIGTSGGLQLLWDRYAYTYGDGQRYGHDRANVVLHSMMMNGQPTSITPTSPPVVSRVGVDVNVVNLSEEEEAMWLMALIWPEHRERREIFRGALKERTLSPPMLIEGDGIEQLPALAKDAPENSTLCVFHTHVANQLTIEKKEALLEHISNIGEERDVFHVYNNMNDRLLHVDSIVNYTSQSEIMGRTDGHGRWFEWLIEMKNA